MGISEDLVIGLMGKCLIGDVRGWNYGGSMTLEIEWLMHPFSFSSSKVWLYTALVGERFVRFVALISHYLEEETFDPRLIG